MNKRVVDPQVVRAMANETRSACQEIDAALRACARDVDQAPWLPWERGHGWGKFRWNEVYGTVQREMFGFLNMGGLQEDAISLYALADRAEWEAALISLPEQFVALPAWVLMEIDNALHPKAPGPTPEDVKLAHQKSVEARAKAEARRKAQELAAKQKTVDDFKATRKQGSVGGQCVTFVKDYVASLGRREALIAPFSSAGKDAKGDWLVTPIPQWDAGCPSFSQPKPWSRIAGGGSVQVGDILFLNWPEAGGHVAIIDSVSADGKTFTFSDSNYLGKGLIRHNVTYRTDDPKVLGVMRLNPA